MSNDNRFGRRNASVRPPELQGQARQRRAEAGGQAEYAVGDVPAPAETSQSQTLLYVAAGVAVLFGTVTIGLIGLPMLSKLLGQSGVTQISSANPASRPVPAAAAREETLARQADEENEQPASEQPASEQPASEQPASEQPASEQKASEP